MCKAEPAAAQGSLGEAFPWKTLKSSSMGEVYRIKFSMLECYFVFLIY